MKKTILSAMIIAMSSAAPVMADVTDVNWDTFGVGFTTYDIDDVDEASPNGITLSGTKLLNENFFALAQYSSVDDDIEGVEVGVDQLSIGFGYRTPLSERSDLYVAASYEYIDMSIAYQRTGVSADESGFGLRVGTRTMMSDVFEVDVNLGYISIDGESETAFGLSGNYFFTEHFSVGLGAGFADDANSFTASVRYSF